MNRRSDNRYSDEEAAHRRHEVIKRMLTTPPKPRRPKAQAKEKPKRPAPRP